MWETSVTCDVSNNRWATDQRRQLHVSSRLPPCYMWKWRCCSAALDVELCFISTLLIAAYSHTNSEASPASSNNTSHTGSESISVSCVLLLPPWSRRLRTERPDVDPLNSVDILIAVSDNQRTLSSSNIQFGRQTFVAPANPRLWLQTWGSTKLCDLFRGDCMWQREGSPTAVWADVKGENLCSLTFTASTRILFLAVQHLQTFQTLSVQVPDRVSACG